MNQFLSAVDSAAAPAIALAASLMMMTAVVETPAFAAGTEAAVRSAAEKSATSKAAPSQPQSGSTDAKSAPSVPAAPAAPAVPSAPAAPSAPTPPTAAAEPPHDVAAEAVWKAYEKRWSETMTYVAGFRQTIEVPDVGTKVESAGRFYFSKPDKVQWEYTEGPPQTVVGDGQWLWVYQPDLEQVYKIPYSKAFGRGGLVALLAGRQGVSERYRSSLQKTGEGTVRIRLTPLDKTEGDLEVTLSADTFDLRGVVVHDPAGSMTNMVFSEPVRNRTLDASLFTFTPPKGVDIITDHETGF